MVLVPWRAVLSVVCVFGAPAPPAPAGSRC